MNISIPIIILLIVLALGGGYFISRPPVNKPAPTVQEQSVVQESKIVETATSTDDVQVNSFKKDPRVIKPAPVLQQSKKQPKDMSVETSITPTPTLPKHIEGLSAIRLYGGIWQNWNADIEKDGPVVEIVYLDKNGESFFDDYKVPISVDVKIYAGATVTGPKNKLVFNKPYSSKQIIFDLRPTVRIPRAEINVNPETDFQNGVIEITVHTPEQGDFSTRDDFIILYEGGALDRNNVTSSVTSINKLTKIGTITRWDSWNNDPAYDGVEVSVIYQEYYGEGLNSTANAAMPISADIKFYSLKPGVAKINADIGTPDLETNTPEYTDKLVYSGHFDKQLISFDGYPIFRIPKEDIKVNPVTDPQRGIVEIIIHTPQQGDFRGIWNHVELYQK